MNGVLVGVLSTLGALAALRVARLALFRRRLRHGRWRGGLVRRLARRLEATPEQERVLLEEVEAMGSSLRDARLGLSSTREDLARAIEAEALDAGALEALGAAAVGQADAVRRRAAAAVARLHGALDAGQRRRLADVLRHRAPLAHRAC
jgi:hypothetical protein